jgi:hypothetical protein
VAQWTTSGQVQQDADGDGQTSPGAGSGSAATPQSPPAPGGQFDASTLGGLLSLQQQPQGTDGAPPPGGHHHHGHHGHGHHGGPQDLGQGQAAGAGSSTGGDTPDVATVAQTQGA